MTISPPPLSLSLVVDDLIQARILVGLQRGRRGSIYLTKSQTLDLRKLNIATVPCVAVSRNLQGGRIMISSKSMSNLVAVICEEHIYFVHLL